MIITRHNYEEYFILYTDNELGSEDRRQVELFTQENPDLKEELDWLLQNRLVPDAALVFDNKELLMKTTGAESINTTNYEEWLLLYTDNELTDAQKIAVEKFAASHPGIKEQLELFQKSKLRPEQGIIFHNKELLYRREEKVRMIAINWRKIAVAAGVLIAISSTALVVYNKKGNSIKEFAFGKQDNIRSIPASSDQHKDENVPNANSDQMAVENNAGKNNVATATTQTNNPLATNNKRTIALKEKNIQPSILPIKKNALAVAENTIEKKKTNDLPETKYNPNANKGIVQDNPVVKADVIMDESLTNSKENTQAPVVTPGNSQSLNNVVAVASIESIDPTDAEQSGKKNKLRGFFRKVTRTFEKTTNIKATDDEDRLLLGGLAFKL